MGRKSLYTERRLRSYPEAKNDIMQYVLTYSAEHGYAPTVRDITEAVGFESTATTQSYINQLIAEGRLERDERRSRTLRVKV